ncbi:hypothetical protein ALC56_02138 [Trachymyrmex septentrionalis]|uniref:Uncharacterized protein n=1 Tax=Trachymyrmex septentrionalis TaxID=34720 RepID=A0A195FSY5_9HYME|nr:hypothetical protein ALC56_02138 [Trachymyrmex septentrionalis]
MAAHDCAYVHVVFNGCRRATEKGRRRRQGRYVHVAIIVGIVDGGGQRDGGVVRPPPFEGRLTLEWKPEARDRCAKRDEV